jgi:formylglycine-generating enzyme required for sulfatase activity
MSFGMGTDSFPAISMTHYAASMFTKWLTAKTGDFYRLPTEAEWEYACKVGGGTVGNIDDKAWHRGNSDRGYKMVGSKEPNRFGLYDILGNVAEWTTDQYFEDYHEKVKELGDEPILNPWFKPTKLYPRAVRGASWLDEKDEVSCIKRRGSEARWKMLDPQIPKSLWWHTNAQFLGFRVVRTLENPSPKEMENYWPEPVDDY